ncbi:anti-sigma factor [Streptomyces zhihengii]
MCSTRCRRPRRRRSRTIWPAASSAAGTSPSSAPPPCAWRTRKRHPHHRACAAASSTPSPAPPGPHPHRAPPPARAAPRARGEPRGRGGPRRHRRLAARPGGDAREQAVTAREQAHAAGAALADVLTAPDATIHTATLPDGASAAVVVSREQGSSAFTARDLPALSGGKVYELWYAAPAGDLRPAGLLPGTGDRAARVLDAPLGDAVAVGITVEPAGGSAQPTTEPLGIIPIDA